MNNFYKKGSKTLLILSCTSILSSLINVPIIHATETESVQQVTEEVVQSEMITYTFQNDTSEDIITTQLFDMTTEELFINGESYKNAIIKVNLSDSKESIVESDDTGQFQFEITALEAEDKITLEVFDQEENLLEKSTFIVKEMIPKPVVDVDAELDEKVNLELENKASQESTEKNTGTETEIVTESQKTKSTFSLKLAENQPVGTTYYYVQTGDTLYKIAQKFSNSGVTVEKLMNWNYITDASKLRVGDVLSINGTNNYKEYNKVNQKFNSNKEFLDFAGKYAKEVAAEHGLYASVMMAQTALETGYGKSSLSTIANNFFGIKAGTGYRGYSIIMPTWEEVNGERVKIDAEFRFYPSYAESFADNADKLKKGLSYSPKFYDGAWIENTNTFKDATLFLNQRYATDTNYHKKINNIILTNNLTRFDTKSYTDTSHNVIVAGENYDIGNLPLDHRNAHNNVKTIANTNKYLGSFLTVSHVTVNGKYANIYLNGTEIGWVDTNSLLKVNQKIKNVDYGAYISAKSTPIYELPLGEKDNSVVATAEEFMNERVQITAQTENGNQSLIIKDGKTIGWILTKDISKATPPKSVILKSSSYSVDTLPWQQGGEHQRIASTSKYIGNELSVVALSSNGAYSLAYLDGKPLGWIDNRALTNFTYSNINSTTYVTSGIYSIDSLPWGTTGQKKVGSTLSLLGKKVQVTKQSTNRAYWFIKVDGVEVGWVDARAFGLSGKSYETLVAYDGYSIDSLPWGTPGFKKVGTTNDFMNQKIQVAGSTQNGAYLLIRQNGKDLGWVDNKAVLSNEAVIVTPYQEYVGSHGYSIDSLPWGTPGFRNLGSTTKLLGKKVTVLAESKNKAYALISAGNKNIGWVDKKAFGLVQIPKNTTINSGNYSIDNLPWGTEGFENVSSTSAYVNQTVEVVGAIKNGAYVLIKQNDKELGWVDRRAISTLNVVPVNQYSIYVGGPGYSIDSLPWGTPGFKKIGDTTQILGKIVTVTQESENRAYAYITVDGTPLGWVDKKAFGLKQNQNSGIILNGGFSIDSLPWGVPGFKKVSSTSDHVGRLVRIIGSTHNGNYVLISKNNATLGWVDARSITKLATNQTNYSGKIKYGHYSIDNLPWGTPGFKKIGLTSEFLNKEVKIIAESLNKAYVFIQIADKDIGWIDKRALN